MAEQIGPFPLHPAIQYVGSATSHFQAEPLLYDESGQPKVRSDWELELTRQLRGERSGIPKADTTSLPQFLRQRERYINRSAELSENMFRFSLDFARLCPGFGDFDEELMADYIRTLALIRAQGQEPFLTLYHFTLPKYLIRLDRDGKIVAGGWEHCDVVKHFHFYVRKVVGFLADEGKVREVLKKTKMGEDVQDQITYEGIARYFLTVNEPAVVLFNGYLGGTFPPYKRGNILTIRRVLNRLIEAHDVAFDEIKQGLRTQKRQPQVGAGYNWQHFEGALGAIAHEFQQYCTNKFERGGVHSDFLGLHYYFRRRVPLLPGEKGRREYSDQPSFGDIYPPGVLEMIRQMHHQYPAKPIFVSEFGFADKNDLRRPHWILETVKYIVEATQIGVPIVGFLLWTLVDNFEWDLGMSQKFGLFSESQLHEPLVPSGRGINSWQVWHAVTKALRSPSTDTLLELQRCRDVAYQQYKQAGGKY